MFSQFWFFSPRFLSIMPLRTFKIVLCCCHLLHFVHWISNFCISGQINPKTHFFSIKLLIELPGSLNSNAYSILILTPLILLFLVKLTLNFILLFNQALDWMNETFKLFHLFYFGSSSFNSCQFCHFFSKFQFSSSIRYSIEWIRPSNFSIFLIWSLVL